MEVVGEAVLSALFQPLFEKLASSELLKFASKKHLNGELDKWKRILQEIHEVLNDAEEKQITTPSVKDWLSKLQDLAYDADDILDEFATEAMAKSIREKSQASTSKVQTLIPTSWNNLKPSAVRRNVEMGSRLKKITARLQEIVTEKDGLKLRTNDQWKSRKVIKREETSLVKERKVYGREGDKEAVVDWLVSGETSSSSFLVISIVGMGGVGKTTIAQCVYNDERVKFDCKAWACVSDIFDVCSISKAILSHWEGCEGDNLNMVQVKLKKQLSGKKFLIVLDDVWSENYEEWTKLCSPFLEGAPGSKIIVTTRNKTVSLKVGSALVYELKKLSNDDCLSLFAQHAVNAENFDQHPSLKEIGQEIANRCKGLPLAAKTLGGLLRGNQDYDEWANILSNEIWELDDKKSDILPALRLSYHHLPSDLKQCFAFCAVFPKDFEFDESELVSLWMAEGFLQPKKQMRMEKLGHLYFRDLVLRSFFQQSAADKSKYVMHDLISDLAQFVSKGICFNLDDKVEAENYKSLAKVRYMTLTRHHYDISKRFELLHQMRGLRMLLPLPIKSRGYLSSHVVNNLVPTLKTLRVLSLAGYVITELPSSIAGLKHLRLLDLSQSNIESLPESLCELYNMQTLLLLRCRKLTRLPDGFCNLINLHHLDIRGTYNLQEMPLAMGKLINLSILSKFVVGKDKGLGVGELKELSHLQGDISIQRLDNVVNIQDAEDANLKGKHDLRGLNLEWSSRSDESLDKNHEEQVLNALRPHQNIVWLTISGYAGISFPSWVGDISNMVYLELSYCRNVTSMPPLGGLPLLRDLKLSGMDGIKELGLEFYGEMPEVFPSLERLTFSDMSNWEQWSNKPNEETTAIFPNLRDLKLRGCPKLVQMYPGILPLLKSLRVADCQQMLLENVPDLPSLTFFEITSISGLEHLNKKLVDSLEALEDISIRECDNLKYLWQDGIDLKKLDCLKRMNLYNCKEMVSLVEGGKGPMPCNLQVLSISGCEHLTSLNGEEEEEILPSSLEKLRIENCDELEKLPNGLKNLTHLSSLGIDSCPKLEVFPAGGLPCSITDLKIKDCRSLKELPEGIMKHGDDENIPSPNLRRLEIRDCPSLVVREIVQIPHSLESVSISNVLLGSVLRSVPNLTSLGELNIWGSLEDLNIRGGDNLSVLSNLSSLRSLSIETWVMESFAERGLPPNLATLSIISSENLKQPMVEWGLHRLTSLTNLEIYGPSPSTDMVVSFPHLQLPTSLTYIFINKFNNLKSISSDIRHLTSLKRLYIWECRKLRCLPKSGLPPTLEFLSIRGCPLLKAVKKLERICVDFD